VTLASQCSIAILVLTLALPSTNALADGPERMTMEEAVRLSLDRNPTFLVAREEIRRAQALVEEARAQSLPTLYGAATYIRLDSDRTLDGAVIEPKSQVNLSALLTVPLVNPVAWSTWSHAKDQVGVSKASALDTRRIIAVAAGHAYLAVFAQKRVLEADVRARDTAKAHFDFAHSRLVGGVGNRLDEVRAAQQLATDETLVQSSRASVVRAQEALSVLVGVDAPVDSAEEPTLPGAPSLPAAIDEATRTRSDVVVADRRKDAAEHVKRDTWTQYSPYATATFQPFYQNPPTSQVPATGWQAEAVLTIPFYDGGLRYGLQKERDALAREAEDTREGTVRQSRSDVRAAFETLRRAEESLTQARSAASLAGEALSLASLAYNAGATTNLEVIDAEQTARDAEIQAEVAADNARQARLDMLAAIGSFPNLDAPRR
jgi:outer membrane protein TolC